MFVYLLMWKRKIRIGKNQDGEIESTKAADARTQTTQRRVNMHFRCVNYTDIFFRAFSADNKVKKNN